MKVSLRVCQLLNSRLCHDLAGGISALSTGAELLAEDPTSLDAGALGLITMSADQTANRLQFMRTAFGMGGGQGGGQGDGSVIAAYTLNKLTQDFLHGGRVQLQWQTANMDMDIMAGKLLLNMCLIASEALPKGGQLEVNLGDVENRLGFGIAAVGEGANLSDEMRAAINVYADSENLTPRTVNGYFMTVLAAQLGAELEISPPHSDVFQMAALL